MILLLDVQVLGQIYPTERFVRRCNVHRCRIKPFQVLYMTFIYLLSIVINQFQSTVKKKKKRTLLTDTLDCVKQRIRDGMLKFLLAGDK